MDDPLNVPKLRGILQVELPSQNLHHLKATFHLKSGARISIVCKCTYWAVTKVAMILLALWTTCFVTLTADNV